MLVLEPPQAFCDFQHHVCFQIWSSTGGWMLHRWCTSSCSENQTQICPFKSSAFASNIYKIYTNPGWPTSFCFRQIIFASNGYNWIQLDNLYIWETWRRIQFFEKDAGQRGKQWRRQKLFQENQLLVERRLQPKSIGFKVKRKSITSWRLFSLTFVFPARLKKILFHDVDAALGLIANLFSLWVQISLYESSSREVDGVEGA